MIQNGTLAFLVFVTDVLMVINLILLVGVRNRLKNQPNIPDLGNVAENISRINKNVIELGKLNEDNIQFNKEVIQLSKAVIVGLGPPAVRNTDQSETRNNGREDETLEDLWGMAIDEDLASQTPETSPPADPPQPPKLYNPVKPVRIFRDSHNPKAGTPEEKKRLGEKMKKDKVAAEARKEPGDNTP